jgi:hypothetical protein
MYNRIWEEKGSYSMRRPGTVLVQGCSEVDEFEVTCIYGWMEVVGSTRLGVA